MRYSNVAALVGFCAAWTSALVVRNDRQVARTQYSAKTVYEFPNNTWVENLAVRSNNDLLLGLVTAPELYILDPDCGNPPALLYTFPTLSVFGIAESSPDVFAVIAGNFSLTAGTTNGSFSVWSVDLHNVSLLADGTLSSAPKVSKIADVPEASLLNGIAVLSEAQGLVLVSDTDAGVIYRLDVNSGAYEVVISNSLTATATDPTFGNVGVNGIAVQDGQLYAANTGQGLIGRMAINGDGTAAGEPVIIARKLNSSDQFDDFAIGRHGNIFAVTGSGESVEEISETGRQVIIAGNLNSTQVAEPTSARFGRGSVGRDFLYVVTAGGLAAPVDGDEVVGGQVVAIKIY